MWSVSPPAISIKETAQACARGTSDGTLAKRLLAARPSLESNNLAFRGSIASHEMHLIEESDYSVPGVSAAEIKWMYTNHFARLGHPARKLYEKLIGAAPEGLCCYCQYGQAKTLDHFVPQNHAGTLSIDPWNLVPACEQCNHKLQAKWGTTAADQMLHPYDMPALGRWLRGIVASHDPIEIAFSIDPLALHETELQDRMVNEFDSLGLAAMYAVVSAGDISIARRYLIRNYKAADDDESVRAHLLEAAGDAFAVDENSRRGVVLEALAQSAWFCAGGYGS
ncbi:hypothetical protein E3T54_12065 [Cryobacterium sp. Sr8]|nr:hypothetical protein E3T54_12065 [Cryobacterium sp. Sr8]